jgi:hypothetical protein
VKESNNLNPEHPEEIPHTEISEIKHPIVELRVPRIESPGPWGRPGIGGIPNIPPLPISI